MKVRHTLRALSDLEAIHEYLAERSPAAALSVKNAIERRISRLADFPLAAPVTDQPGVRELTLGRYPYKVYYEIDDDELWIVHIRDARRQPWEGD